MVAIHKRPFAPPTQRAGLAIAAMVLGVFAVVFSGLAFVTLGWLAIAPLAGIPALICGFMALRRANANPVAYGGRGFAVAGILAACAAIPLAVVALSIIFYPPMIAMVHSATGGVGGTSGGGTGGPGEDETHDPASLTELPYYSAAMQCRVRLPRGAETITLLPPPDASVERGGADRAGEMRPGRAGRGGRRVVRLFRSGGWLRPRRAAPAGGACGGRGGGSAAKGDGAACAAGRGGGTGRAGGSADHDAGGCDGGAGVGGWGAAQRGRCGFWRRCRWWSRGMWKWCR